MLSKLIVVDNIFSEEELVFIHEDISNRTFYLTHEHPDSIVSSWKGKRTKALYTSTEQTYRSYANKIINTAFDKSFEPHQIDRSVKYSIDMRYHDLCFSREENESWEHRDTNCVYAGVVYLDKNPKDNCGTIIWSDGEKHEIKNVYNRLVLYNASLLHGAQDGYPGRLTLTFFISDIEISLKPHHI